MGLHGLATPSDWLMLPTTVNQAIGIKEPNLHKILIFFPPPSPWVFAVSHSYLQLILAPSVGFHGYLHLAAVLSEVSHSPF